MLAKWNLNYDHDPETNKNKNKADTTDDTNVCIY